MKLRQLAAAAALPAPAGAADPEISAIVYDSRAARPGCLFAALPGTKADGAAFVAAAAAAGAAAVLGDAKAAAAAAAAGLPAIASDRPREALSRLANAFHGFPSRKMKLVGITGTNGKTTTAFIIRHLARHCGLKAGMLGTIEYDTLARAVPAPLTTPESVDFAAYLAEAATAGAEIMAAEVSSHALALGRVAGCDFAAAVFTNLTRDHLDYHGTLANYAAAKHKLFLALAPGAPAVVNLDDPQAGTMLEGCAGRPETYGIDDPAAVWNAVGLVSGIDGSVFTLRHGGPAGTGEHRVHLPVPGRHNVHNALAALAALAPLGLPLDGLIEGLANFKSAPGRLETIRHEGRTACIDYAHTPDALEKALLALRPLTPGKLWVVFGCGGDRDRGKRPQMAAVAERLADKVVVTSDNPRTEPPEQILEDIRAGFADMDMPDFIPARDAAIAHALRAAAAGDTVLIAGKGHEDYQIIGTVKHHFSDRECVEETWK